MFDNTYDFMLRPYFGRLFKPGKPVSHQQTCPTCGRTLVNLYRRDGMWKCKQCWDETKSALTPQKL